MDRDPISEVPVSVPRKPSTRARGGWIEDIPEDQGEAPQAAPVGYVETLPGKPPRKPKRAPEDVVKMGWGSERVNRRLRSLDPESLPRRGPPATRRKTPGPLWSFGPEPANARSLKRPKKAIHR